MEDADGLDMEAFVASSVEEAVADHNDSASESDYSDVATPVELEQRVPKGAELRLVAKVLQLGGFTTIKMPKEPGTVRLVAIRCAVARRGGALPCLAAILPVSESWV